MSFCSIINVVTNSEWVCGIDLGGKNRKTTGVCLLKIVNGKPKYDKRRCNFCRVIPGETLLSYLKPYLARIETIAIDGPLTLGPGKGRMRLWEKFFSTKPFRRVHLNPIPPAAIWRLSYRGTEVLSEISSFGFELDKNLIEVFSSFTKRVLKRLPKVPCSDQNERDAFICALLAAYHLEKKTFWIGHRDGKLFLPSLKLWKKDWQKRFKKLWRERHPFKYKFLKIGGFP